VKDHGLTIPVWLDPQNKSEGFFKNWYLPGSYVFDKAGMVRLSWAGRINQAALEQYITRSLEENE
jgi:hypothetical protein